MNSGSSANGVLSLPPAGTAPDTYSGGTLQATEDLLLGATISLERFLATSKQLKKGDIWESLRSEARRS